MGSIKFTVSGEFGPFMVLLKQDNMNGITVKKMLIQPQDSGVEQEFNNVDIGNYVLLVYDTVGGFDNSCVIEITPTTTTTTTTTLAPTTTTVAPTTTTVSPTTTTTTTTLPPTTTTTTTAPPNVTFIINNNSSYSVLAVDINNDAEMNYLSGFGLPIAPSGQAVGTITPQGIYNILISGIKGISADIKVKFRGSDMNEQCISQGEDVGISYNIEGIDVQCFDTVSGFGGYDVVITVEDGTC